MTWLLRFLAAAALCAGAAHGAKVVGRGGNLRLGGQQRALTSLAELGEDLKLSAMVVDQRCSPSLLLAIANIHAELPGLPIQVFYGSGNKEFLESSLVGAMHIPNLTLTPLPGRFYDRLDRNAYQVLFEQPAFWEYVRGDKVLTFQGDTWLCQNAAEKLQRFLQYDYIGAPWGHEVPGCTNNVGNGGLSIRSRRMMEKASAASKELTWPPMPEDVFFCRELMLIDPNGVAPEDVAAKFSNEEYVDASHDPLGFHSIASHNLSPESTATLSQACPGMDVLQASQAQPETCEQAKLAAADALQQYGRILEARAAGGR